MNPIKAKVKAFLKDPSQKKIEIEVPKDFKISSVTNPIRVLKNKLFLWKALRIIPSHFKNWYLRRLGINVGHDACIAGFIQFDPYFPELISVDKGVLIGGYATFNTHQIKDGKLILGRIHLKEEMLVAGFVTINPGVTANKHVILGTDAVVNDDAPEGTFFAGNPARVIKEWTKDEIKRHFVKDKIDPNFVSKVKRMTKKFRKDKKIRTIRFRNEGKRLTAGSYWYIARPVLRIYYNALLLEFGYYAPFEWMRKLFFRLMGAKIGKNVRFGKGIIFDQIYGDMCTVEDDVVLEDNVYLDNHEYTNTETVYGRTLIKKGAHIKKGAWVRGGAIVGENAVIEPMARVMKDVPAGETWAGNPAKPVKDE